MKISELRSLWERTVDADRSIKPSTKFYKKECIKYAFRTWPEAAEKEVEKITALECLDWSTKWQDYSAGRFNGILFNVRAMFALAVETDIITKNPCSLVKQAPMPIRHPKLPSHDQFKQIIAHMEKSPWSQRAIKLVKFLAYSGRRIGEARKLRREDIGENTITVRDTKNGEDITVPMTPALRELIKTLPVRGPLFRIANPRHALKNACNAVGIKPLTNHQLRHIFATRCIESGVDVATTAMFLGHSDGGKLALQRYSHVRAEHAEEMAARVRF